MKMKTEVFTGIWLKKCNNSENYKNYKNIVDNTCIIVYNHTCEQNERAGRREDGNLSGQFSRRTRVSEDP